MSKNIIKQFNLSGNLLSLEIGKAFHKISFAGGSMEYAVTEFTLQDVNKDFISLLTKNAENLSSTEHIHEGLGYVAQRVLIEDSTRISKVLKSVELKNLFDHKGYHFTLYYDRLNPVIEYNEMSRDVFFTATPVGVKILAPDSPTPALAIIFESKELDARFKELKELGFTSDFEDFIPHVTVKYNPEDGDFELLKENLDFIINSVGVIKCGFETWRVSKT